MINAVQKFLEITGVGGRTRNRRWELGGQLNSAQRQKGPHSRKTAEKSIPDQEFAKCKGPVVGGELGMEELSEGAGVAEVGGRISRTGEEFGFLAMKTLWKRTLFRSTIRHQSEAWECV